MKKYLPYVVSLLIVALIGGIGAFVTATGMQVYEQLIKPPLTPPPILFPIVWTILYVLMAVGATLVWKSDKPLRGAALTIYATQLLFNCLWSIVFFGLHVYLAAFFWLMVLWVLIIVMIVLFYKIKPIAGYLQIPYLLWVSFASYLNFALWWLNR